MLFKQWEGFQEGSWEDSVDVRQFIQKNYTPYTGDESFLANATEKTTKLWNIVLDLYKKEKENGGVLCLMVELELLKNLVKLTDER